MDSLLSLQEALSSNLRQKKPVASEALQAHFAELMLEPGHYDPGIPSELSDALRICVRDNANISLVYQSIDRILTLQNSPNGMEAEFRLFVREYANQSIAFRRSQVGSGRTLQVCFRVLSYLKMRGFISDVRSFFAEVDVQILARNITFSDQFAVFAADLYSDLTLFGPEEVDRLAWMFGFSRSRYVLRMVEEDVEA